MYEATFSTERLYGVLPNTWVQCEGIRLESNLGFPFITDICRSLKDAGKPDGPIALYEDGYAEPSYTHASIYEIADREPMTSQTAAKLELTDALYRALAQIESGDWVGLQSRVRNVLLDRQLVMIDGDKPQITDLGRRAKADFVLRPVKNTLLKYPDIAAATPQEIEQAAELIGLKANGINMARTLALIERTITDHQLPDILRMARRAGVSLRAAGRGSDEMRRRRLLAAIINAGKIAEVL